MLSKMLIVYAGVSSNAVESTIEKKNMLENTYHCRFPRDHSWYMVLASEWPAVLTLCERLVTGGSQRPQWLYLPLCRSRHWSEQPWWPPVTRISQWEPVWGLDWDHRSVVSQFSDLLPRVWLKPSNLGVYLQNTANSQLEIGLPWVLLAPCI